MLVKKILGKEVIGANGDKIGKISDIDIDIIASRVKNAVITSGFRTKYKIKLEDIISVGDKVIIRFNEEDLKKSSPKSK